MSNFYGNGVGIHLDASNRQYTNVVMQKGKPPIAEEMNLLNDVVENARQEFVSANIPSGFISNPFQPKLDYQFDPDASNMFWLGKEDEISYAVVNGWTIPVAGTLNSDLRNAIKLEGPDSSTPDVNFVFLEVWKSQISPTGTLNKPAEDQIFKYGNVEFGGTNLVNQILDERFGIETSERVQLQYRFRVIKNSNPGTNPYGFNMSINAQGPNSGPVSGFYFENMGEKLGDSGLWRAGVANTNSSTGISVTKSPLNTVDGYIYAIPVCFVFRRTNTSWTETNHHGSENRNPAMPSRYDASVLEIPKVAVTLSKTDMTLEVDLSRISTFFPRTNGLICIGSEVMRYSLWDDGTTIKIEERGYKGSYISQHKEGEEIRYVTGHPLGIFSDQIREDDVFDLRHIINITGFSYDALLKHNFSKLVRGTLKTQWKGGKKSHELKGTQHFQIDQFTKGNVSNHLEGDAPDGFRKIFSDASVIQPGNLLVASTLEGPENPLSKDEYSLNPLGSSYLHKGNATWQVGDSITLQLNPLRDTFKTSRNKVRFIHPLEYKGKGHSPVRVWFGDYNTPIMKEEGKHFHVFGSAPSDVLPEFLSGTNSSVNFTSPDIIEISISGNPLDFSTPGPSGHSTVAEYLASQNAYLIIQDNIADIPTYKGAFKIVGGQGQGQGKGLQLVKANGDSPSFGTVPKTANWKIRLRECSETDDELIMVLTDTGIPGQNDFIANKTLYMTYDVLYHPNQGLARIPDNTLTVRMSPLSDVSYLRDNSYSNIVSSGVADVKDFPVNEMTEYPTTEFEDSVWSEAYVDKGSKTVLLQPVREAEIFCDTDSNPTGSTSSYATGPGSDPRLGFKLLDNNSCYFVPKEVLPRGSRLRLPFSKSNQSYGINAIFSSWNNPVFVKTRTLFLYDYLDTNPLVDYGSIVELSTIGSGTSSEYALVCKPYNKNGIQGLELPPHFGVSRLFGAYIRDEYFNHGPDNHSPSYTGNNILKTTQAEVSLYITPENSFVIPFEVLDLQYLPHDLNQSQIIFEMSVFMFNDWWQDRVQIHTINNPTGDTLKLLLNGPCDPLDSFNVISTRVPYQGNLTGTLGVSYQNDASMIQLDYDWKEQVDQRSDYDNMTRPLNPDTVTAKNPVKLEILTSMPFFTTEGTGKISGKYKAGTYTDVGYISQEGFPSVSNQRKVKTGALEGDVNSDRSLAGATERLPLGVLGNDHLFLGEPVTDLQTTFQVYSGASCPEGLVIMSDGTSRGDAQGNSYKNTVNMYRTYRGGALTKASDKKGDPVEISNGTVSKHYPELKSFETSYNEILTQRILNIITDTEMLAQVSELKSLYSKIFQIHGSVLFGVAFLVRTYTEEVTSNDIVVNHGNELQMLVVTGSSFGTDPVLDATKEVLKLLIQIHPNGLGEGYSSADRYRIEGRPLQKGSGTKSDIDFDLVDNGNNGGSNPPCPC